MHICDYFYCVLYAIFISSFYWCATCVITFQLGTKKGEPAFIAVTLLIRGYCYYLLRENLKISSYGTYACA